MSMDFKKCVKERRSVRRFKADRVPDEVLESIVTSASYSPSWKNTQTTRYIMVENAELKDGLAQTCMMDFDHNRDIVISAPAAIIVTSITGRAGHERDGTFTTSLGQHWESFDAGVATQTLCLSAHAEGLGAVILGVFDADKTGKLAGVPDGQKVAAIVAIGYPDEAPAMPKRKTAAELLDYRR